MSDWSIADPLVAPLAFNLVAVFGAWVYYEAFGAGRAAREGIKRIYRCSRCGHVYEEVRDVPMAQCPVCRTLNEAVHR